MNRKNLAELLAAVALAAAVCGCASAPPPRPMADTQQASGDPGIARNNWRQCIRAAIPRVDDPHSASDVVARAAMKSCSNEYADMTRALPRDALAKAQREARQIATDDVVTARVQIAGERSLKCQ